MRVALTGFAVGLLLAAPAAADFVEHLPVQPAGVLEVDLDFGEGLRPDPGRLDVVSHDTDEVRVMAEASGWGAWSIKFDLSGDEARARFVATVGGSFSWMFGGPQLRVRIWVPREFSLDLRCSAGPIRVEGVSGRIRASTRGADVELVGTEGPARLRTTDGAVRVMEVLGDVEIRTGAGPIEVSWVTGGLEARTGAGPIEVKHVDGPIALTSEGGAISLHDVGGRVEARTERGPVLASFVGAPAGFLETRRGPVDVFLPEQAGAELEARSARGQIEIGPGLAWEGEQEEGRAVGRINGGGAPFRVYTGRGQVRVYPR